MVVPGNNCNQKNFYDPTTIKGIYRDKLPKKSILLTHPDNVI
jgi:hypothetical protein